MCLYSVSNKKHPTPRHAWKVFSVVNGKLLTPVFNEKISLGLNIDTCAYQIRADSDALYRTGFHAFLRREDARRSFLNLSKEAAVFRVIVDDIRAHGEGALGDRQVVAGSMCIDMTCRDNIRVLEKHGIIPSETVQGPKG